MKIVKMILNGIAWGCTICTFVMLIGAAAVGDDFLALNAKQFIKQAIGSMIVGIGFTVPCLIYNANRLSRVLQTLIHMGIGFAVYLPIASYLGWLPTDYGVGMLVLSLVIAVVFYFVIWLFYYLHNRKEAARLNEKLQGME